MTEPHLSELALDRARLGLDPAAEAHLAACLPCRVRRDARAATDAAFLAAHPAPRALAPPRAARAGWIAGALALAAGLLAVVLAPPREASERPKGGSAVELWVERGGRPGRYAGEPLAEGDTLVFRYTTARRYLVVVSVEDDGHRSVMVSDARGHSATITPGRGVSPIGARLDAATGAERVYAVLSDRPLDGAAIAEALARGEAPNDADVSAWTVARSPR